MKYKTWRLIHRYSFGTWKWFMILTSIILIIISITGIVLIHEHDTNFFYRVKVPTAILPSQYEEKIDNIRAAQGSAKAHFNKEVAPHVKDAWIDAGKCDERDEQIGVVGYEIPFNRHFYQYHKVFLL